MKKWFKWIVGILAFLALVFLILQIPKVADAAGKVINETGETVSNFAKTGLWVSVGLILVIAGIKSMAVPVIGIALILVGAGLLLFAVWPTIFVSKKPE